MDKKKKREEILIRIACLIISFGLWIYIYSVENPIKTNKLSNVPVQILNSDVLANSKLTILPGQNFTVTLSLEGPASEVYAAKPEQFKVELDLGVYAVKKGENKIPVTILQHPPNVNVKNEGLMVKVILDDLIEKSVPIKLDADTSTKTGFYSFDPIVKPTNALVSGPAQYVDSVKWVLAKGSFKNADGDISLTLPLKAVDEAFRDVLEVKVNPTNADVVIPVKKAKTVDINVKTKGTLNKGFLLKSIDAIPTKIDIAGDDATVRNISSIDTEPIDLSLINSSKEVAVKLVVPKNVTLVNSKDIINVKINLETIAQKTISRTIALTNLNEQLKAVLDKDKISIVIQGPESLINDLKEEDLIPTIDLSGQVEGEFNLAPKIKGKDGITIISFTPEKIKVTISKK